MGSDSRQPTSLPASDIKRSGCSLSEEALRQDPDALSQDELRGLAEALQTAHVELIQQFEDLNAAYSEVAASCDGYRMLFEWVPVGYLIIDEQGRIDHLNIRTAELLGADPNRVQGKNFADYLHPASQDAWFTYRQALTPRMDRQVVTLRLMSGSSNEQAVHCEALPELKRDSDQHTRYRVTLTDVTNWLRTLERHDELLKTVNAAPIWFGLADPEGKIRFQNLAIDQDLGENSPTAPATVDDYHPDWAARKVREEALPEAAHTGTWQGETAIRRSDGSCIPALQTILAHWDWQGKLRAYSTVIQDLTPVYSLERLMYQDPLTDLPNRMLLQDRVKQEVLNRVHDDNGLAVIVLDIWGFRSINNGLGKAAGDELLQLMGQRLVDAVGEADTVARIAGDAFGILLTRVSKPEEAADMAQKVLEAAEMPYRLGGVEHAVRVHAGITTCFATCTSECRNGADNALLERADSARREAEQQEVGYLFYAEDLSARDQERITLMADLRRALSSDDELALYYQPQCDLESGEPLAYEALIRWANPERGWVSPEKFIPVAEHSGLIGPIGAWVLERACADAASWLAKGYEFQRTAINVAAPQLQDPNFPAQVWATLKRNGLPANRLEVEITESLVVTPETEILACLDELRSFGVSVAVDDFGTGYSALSYLVDLPIDRLKIDGHFIEGIAESVRKRMIVRAVAGIAQNLGLELVAERIENEVERDVLLAEGCRRGQGFLFGRATPAGQGLSSSETV